MPNGPELKWLEDADSLVDALGWELFIWRSDKTSKPQSNRFGDTSCTIDPQGRAWKSARSLIITTQSDLIGMVKKGHFASLRDRFERECVDECQGFRRCDTKKLGALSQMNARFRHCFSATIVHDTLQDIHG